MNLTRSLKQPLMALALTFAMVAAAFAPASAFLDKTRFALHLGVAYFCFHHWVMKPYEQGAFASGAPHRTAALIKGGAALLFAVHEVHVAERIAAKSKDPLLQKLDRGVASLESSFASVGSRLKSGQFNPSDVSSLSTQTGQVSSDAAAGGTTIKDVPTTVPGM